MSIIWAFQNSDTVTKQNWDMHVIWILIWFYLFLVLALLMLLFSIPSSFCSSFPMNGISCECICCFYQSNMKPKEICIYDIPKSFGQLLICCYLWVFYRLLKDVFLILLSNREMSAVRWLLPCFVPFPIPQALIFIYSNAALQGGYCEGCLLHTLSELSASICRL